MTDEPHLPALVPLTATLPDPWRGMLGGYLMEVYNRSRSKRTVEEYGRIVVRFLGQVQDLNDVTPGAVQRFVSGATPGTRVARLPSPSTVRVRLAAVRGFFAYLVRMRLIRHNPTDFVKAPGNRESAVRGLTGEEVRRLLDVIPDNRVGLRDRAIILVMVLAGLRRSEALGLRAGDLSRNGAVYYTARTKGGQERRREMPAPALRAIERAVEATGRRLEDLDPTDRLFPVASHGFYTNLRRYAGDAGLEGVTPHVLRHSAAKLRRDAGASIEDVQALLGHRSLATTATYLRRLVGEEDAGWAPVAAELGLTDE